MKKYGYIGKATYRRMVRRLQLPNLEHEEMINHDGRIVLRVKVVKSSLNTNLSRFVYNNPKGEFYIGDGIIDKNKVKITKVLKTFWGIEDPQRLKELKGIWESYYNPDVEIVDDIVNVYNSKHSTKGVIKNSCMIGMGEYYLYLKSLFRDKVKVAVIRRGDVIIGRALLWQVDMAIDLDTGETFEGIIFMDRRYYEDESVEERLRRWAREKGFWVREKNSYEDTEKVLDDKGRRRRVWMVVRATGSVEGDWEMENFPFMDTFYVLVEGMGNEVWITNSKAKVKMESNSVYRFFLLRQTDGEVTPYSFCSLCGEMVEEDTLEEVYSGELVCHHCLRNYYVFCDDINDYAHIDQAENCAFCGSFYYREKLYQYEDSRGKRYNICKRCIARKVGVEIVWCKEREAYISINDICEG